MSNWTHYSSIYTGHPSLAGVAGSLTNLLDAVLVNGTTPQSVSSITRSGSTATLTCAAHGIAIGDCGWREVSGAAETAYNGEFLMTAVTATTLTYTVAGTPTTPATGTITYRTKPAGWSISHTGTNKRVYLAGPASVARKWFQVLDNALGTGGAKEARLTGYNVMDSVDVGRYPFPLVSQYASGLFIPKSNTADATVRQWDIWADDRTVIGFFQTGATGGSVFPFVSIYFGEYFTRIPGDTTAACIAANVWENSGINGGGPFGEEAWGNVPSANINNSYVFSAGDGNGFNLSTRLGIPPTAYSASSAGTFYGSLPYPNNSDGGLYLSSFSMYRGPTFPRPVGYLRGLFRTAHNVSAFTTDAQRLSGVADWSGYSFYIKYPVSCGGVYTHHLFVLNNQNPPASA